MGKKSTPIDEDLAEDYRERMRRLSRDAPELARDFLDYLPTRPIEPLAAFDEWIRIAEEGEETPFLKSERALLLGAVCVAPDGTRRAWVKKGKLHFTKRAHTEDAITPDQMSRFVKQEKGEPADEYLGRLAQLMFGSTGEAVKEMPAARLPYAEDEF